MRTSPAAFAAVVAEVHAYRMPAGKSHRRILGVDHGGDIHD
jgi:hypothetical protein